MKSKRMAIAVISILLVLSAVLFVVQKKATGSTDINIALDDESAIIHYKGYTFNNESIETVKGVESEDTVHSYDVYEQDSQIGTLSVTIRKISNGDKFVFTKFENQSDKSITVPVNITLNGTDNHVSYQFVDEEPVREHDRVYGTDYTSNVKGLYRISEKQDLKYDLFLSQNYISKQLIKEYEDEEASRLRELVSEDRYIDIQQDNNATSFHLLLRTTGGDQISEQWFMLSKNKLFESEEALESYKSITNHKFLHAQKWLTADGNYTKLPWSIEPGTKVGYGRNLVALQDKTSLEGYKETKDRFYYNMVINSINNLLTFKSDDDKLWETEYTSTWLNKEYGIRAPYTDTRHNETVALFLTNAGKELGIESIADSYLLYANFLAEQEKAGNVILTENGYYITDYFSDTQTKKTHVSLNHALGEMNFLLNTYKETSDKKYLETALSIKRGVEDNGIEWVNPENGDLWYQINGDYSFEGKDYETLTLKDLATSVQYFKELNLEYDSVFHELIQSKTQYIAENNIEISSTIIDQLNELGLGKQLEKHKNIISF